MRRRSPLEVLAACAAPFEKRESSSAMAKLLLASGTFSVEELAGGIGAGAARRPHSPPMVGRRSHLLEKRKKLPFNTTQAKALLETCSYAFRTETASYMQVKRRRTLSDDSD